MHGKRLKNSNDLDLRENEYPENNFFSMEKYPDLFMEFIMVLRIIFYSRRLYSFYWTTSRNGNISIITNDWIIERVG